MPKITLTIVFFMVYRLLIESVSNGSVLKQGFRRETKSKMKAFKFIKK